MGWRRRRGAAVRSGSKRSNATTKTAFPTAPATPMDAGPPRTRATAPGPAASNTSATMPQSVQAQAWSTTNLGPPSNGIHLRYPGRTAGPWTPCVARAASPRQPAAAQSSEDADVSWTTDSSGHGVTAPSASHASTTPAATSKNARPASGPDRFAATTSRGSASATKRPTL